MIFLVRFIIPIIQLVCRFVSVEFGRSFLLLLIVPDEGHEAENLGINLALFLILVLFCVVFGFSFYIMVIIYPFVVHLCVQVGIFTTFIISL